ncbi:MAG: amidohydrolase family protein [Verrucomicrobia bacterium]|nr:amidohydrolase family protein [Verrucomicrobiota bacterium]
MSSIALLTHGYFDGTRLHERGPYTIEIANGLVEQVHAGDVGAAVAARRLQQFGEKCEVIAAPFVMPGLVEAHCHLFLDGAELDFQKRKDYLTAPKDEMLAVGRRTLGQNLAAGITLIRDAGDLHGINTALKAELTQQSAVAPELLSAGRAIRKAGRYGSFMAVEVTDADSVVRTIRELAPTADQLKILLTGIIDFEKGKMKGGVQFDLAEAKLIVQTARELGLRTFAHCSGPEGLRIAVAAGINSIEHGFFMERDLLRALVDQGIAWVPTFAPVYFQYARPELSGWNQQTVAALWAILEHHFEHVALASEMGVPIVAGSDAGSYGVPHGQGLIDELFFLRRAGLPLDKVLAAATSVPRRLWGCRAVDFTPGSRAALIVLEGSPFQKLEHLCRVRRILPASACSHVSP